APTARGRRRVRRRGRLRAAAGCEQDQGDRGASAHRAGRSTVREELRTPSPAARGEGTMHAMSRIEITTDDGVCPAYLYDPEDGPSVLFFIDGIGMRPAIQEVAEKLGAAGYRVLAPDMFYRVGPYTAPEPKALFSDPAVRAAWFQKVSATS